MLGSELRQLKHQQTLERPRPDRQTRTRGAVRARNPGVAPSETAPYIIRQSGPAQPHSSSGEDSMQVSRRDFLQLTASAGAGTAIGGLVGLGVTLAPAAARAQELRIKDAKTTPSICPFCSVGCATLIHTVDGKIVNIEGDPRSPHNEIGRASCRERVADTELDR